MDRTLTYEPTSLDRINELFERHSDTRLAAAVDGVLEGLREGRDEFRALTVDDEPFHVPDELSYQPLRSALGGMVFVRADEGPDREPLPAWALVYVVLETGGVEIRFAGPRAQYVT